MHTCYCAVSVSYIRTLNGTMKHLLEAVISRRRLSEERTISLSHLAAL